MFIRVNAKIIKPCYSIWRWWLEMSTGVEVCPELTGHLLVESDVCRSVTIYRYEDFNSRWKFKPCRVFKFYFLSKEKTHPRGTFESMLFEHRKTKRTRETLWAWLNKENLINSRRSFARKVSVGFDVSSSGTGGRFVFFFRPKGKLNRNLIQNFDYLQSLTGCSQNVFWVHFPWILDSSRWLNSWFDAADSFGDVVEVWRY